LDFVDRLNARLFRKYDNLFYGTTSHRE